MIVNGPQFSLCTNPSNQPIKFTISKDVVVMRLFSLGKTVGKYSTVPIILQYLVMKYYNLFSNCTFIKIV